MKLSKPLFLLIITIIPFSFAINPASGIDLNVIRILIPLLFIVWLGESLFYRKVFIDIRPRFLFLSLFLVILFLSFFWASEQQRALRKILYLFSIIPIYLIAFDLFKKNLSKDTFLKIILATSLIQAILGIFQFVLQFIIKIDPSLKLWRAFSTFFLGKSFAESVHQYSSWLVNLNGKTVLRAFGTFPDPHLFSLFTALSLPLSWYFFKKTKKWHYLIFFFIQLMAVTLSFSRSSYLAVFVFLAIIAMTEIKKKFKDKKKIWIYVFGIVALLLIGLSPNPVSKRLYSSFNLQEGSNQGRIEMWNKSFEAIKENTLGGVGIGNFSYYVKPSSNFREPIYAHNIFLDFGAETGIISLILLILIFASVFSSFLLKNKRFLDNMFVYFFVIFLIFSLFETPFYSVRIFPIFLIFLAIPHEKN